MKKNEYVSPEMEIVEINTESFIASSTTEPGVSGGTGGKGDNNENPFGSRHGGFDDED